MEGVLIEEGWTNEGDAIGCDGLYFAPLFALVEREECHIASLRYKGCGMQRWNFWHLA
jgi:hypothetical protein